MPKTQHPKIVFLLPILLLTMVLGQAQDPDDSYAPLWEKVHQLESDDLTQSALEVAKSISEKAKKEDNPPQIVKSLLYTSKYAMILGEDAQLKIVNDFKSEITKAEFPTKNILESYLANLYWQYFQQNRYQFYERTKTDAKVDSVDFRTWDLTTLFHEIGKHFEASLENKKGLQKMGLDTFKEILDEHPGSKTYRPTLFDVLAHTALQFYKTDENSITRPADKFEIDDPELLCGAYEFTQREIDLQDKTSLQAKALSLYQELIKFHFPDPELAALVEVDIERLNYIHQNAVFADKDRVYLEVLQHSAENLKQHEISALYTYQIAELYNEQGIAYDPNSEERDHSGQKQEHPLKKNDRWKKKEALMLCESVMAQFPDSRGADKCKALKLEILAPSLQLTTEKNIPIHTETRLLVDYKNLEALQLSALSITQKQLQELNRRYPQTEQLKFLKKLPVAKTWNAELKDEKDFQRHGIEILLPPLDNGQYVIMATPLGGDGPMDENEKDAMDDAFAFSPLQVTNMALIITKTPDSHIFQVVDRQDGHPISGAGLQLTYLQNYNKPLLKKSLTTDAEGMVDIPLSDENWSDVNVLVTDGGEEAHFEPYYISRKYDTDTTSTDTHAAFLFTDRSIYRPSQPLYFKGIVVENQKDRSTVAAEEKGIVTLYDVNGQKVSERDFETNGFGSFSGEFILPNNGLTGEYYIEVQGTSGHFRKNHSFSVEEYKRPRFETSFRPLTETFRVNDSISVKGSATAYAGSNVTNAKVSYRVKRVVYFPRWYYWRHPHFKTTAQEIARGETLTDASGHYEINFKALPDTSIPRENLPIFRYEVTADVTDINGETHTANTTVSVGYHALTATIDLPERLKKGAKTDTITVSTNNLNGQPIAARGTLRMYKLQAPENVLRPRPWEAPDYKNWDRAEFKVLFPHEAFGSEDDPATWEKGEQVWKGAFDMGRSAKIPLDISKKWASGRYAIELETMDKFGQEVKAVAQTTVYVEADKKPADNRLFLIKTDKEKYKVGDEVEVIVASASQNLTVTVFVEKDKEIVA
ncbi:MAG TPA: MG2 domain-containing protein, partial [Pricia sp.]|nr:MG2 domain-containing protein [Pricia sp.]